MVAQGKGDKILGCATVTEIPALLNFPWFEPVPALILPP